LIFFKKLRYKNLLSTGNVFTEINLHSHNTTLIVGENGAGKSTILDALSFGLFGKPFRKVNKGQLINTINNKALLVEVEFTVGNKNYLIQRGAKPNMFNVYQDGVLINNDASAGDYQEMLDKQVLKINHKTFSQIVVLGSASFVPFMQMTAANRREVIEDLLDIQIFTTMNTLLKDKIALNKSTITDVDYAMQGIADKIEIEKKHLQILQSSNDEQIAAKRLKIAEYEGSIQEADSEILAYMEQHTAYQDLDAIQSLHLKKQTKLNTVYHQLCTKSHDIDKDILFFSTHDDCPVCQQGIDHVFKDSTVEEKKNKKQELTQAIEELDSKIAGVSTALRNVEALILERAVWTANINDRQRDIVFWQRLIGEMQTDIDQLESTPHIEDNTNRLTDLRVQLKEKITQREALGKQKATLEMAAVLLKDTGIKTKIIRQYIPVINKLINKYLASMDFFVNFELDENFEEKIKSRFRDEFSYASFSEGEKSRLDLALLFTWRSISRLRNSTSTNLLILDEVFDGSLDAQGNEELLKILDTLTDGNNVFVISHKTDAYLDKFNRVLKFEKQKNFSTMIEL
jgi:DNA repair exonuclease SbcCD ATPase subunit